MRADDGYGYGGVAGPFWLEPLFGDETHSPEGEESSYWPFTVRRSWEDTSGLEVTLGVSYDGTAVAVDFLYRQTSVIMGPDFA